MAGKVVLGAYYQGGKTESNLNQSAFMINAYGEKKVKKVAIGFRCRLFVRK
jgi:hypothetical protein